MMGQVDGWNQENLSKRQGEVDKHDICAETSHLRDAIELGLALVKAPSGTRHHTWSYRAFNPKGPLARLQATSTYPPNPNYVQIEILNRTHSLGVGLPRKFNPRIDRKK